MSDPKLTTAEIALAKVLHVCKDWKWSYGKSDADSTMRDVVLDLYRRGYLDGESFVTTLGLILLDRARKAGVL